MNERITELAMSIQRDRHWTEEDIEKFAELIIQECAGKVDNILREKKDGGGTMGDEIREHFGVSE
jgi:hypothetical protein